MKAADSREAVLELENVRCAWSETWWSNRNDKFEGANLLLRAGEWCGLIGDNGLGKSTLLHAIAGTCPHVRGTIRVCGYLLRQRDIDQRQRYGGVYLVPQEPKCTATWKFEDIKRMSYGCRPGLERAEWVDGLIRKLASVRVLDREQRRTFSASEARILIGLLIMPSVLLLDEAGQRLTRITAPDDLTKKEIMPANEFYSLVRELLPLSSVLFVEHDLRVAAEHSDKLLQLTLSSYEKNDVYSFRQLQPNEINTKSTGGGFFASETSEPGLPLLMLDQRVDEHLWLSMRASKLSVQLATESLAIAEHDWQFLRIAKRVDELSGGQKVILHSVMELLGDCKINLDHEGMKHVSQANIMKLQQLRNRLGEF